MECRHMEYSIDCKAYRRMFLVASLALELQPIIHGDCIQLSRVISEFLELKKVNWNVPECSGMFQSVSELPRAIAVARSDQGVAMLLL